MKFVLLHGFNTTHSNYFIVTNKLDFSKQSAKKLKKKLFIYCINLTDGKVNQGARAISWSEMKFHPVDFRIAPQIRGLSDRWFETLNTVTIQYDSEEKVESKNKLLPIGDAPTGKKFRVQTFATFS